MPECPSSQCFTAPGRATLPAIVAKFTAAAAVEPLTVTFAGIPQSRMVARPVTLPHASRDIYLKIRVLLI